MNYTSNQILEMMAGMFQFEGQSSGRQSQAEVGKVFASARPCQLLALKLMLIAGWSNSMKLENVF